MQVELSWACLAAVAQPGREDVLELRMKALRWAMMSVADQEPRRTRGGGLCGPACGPELACAPWHSPRRSCVEPAVPEVEAVQDGAGPELTAKRGGGAG